MPLDCSCLQKKEVQHSPNFELEPMNGRGEGNSVGFMAIRDSNGHVVRNRVVKKIRVLLINAYAGLSSFLLLLQQY